MAIGAQSSVYPPDHPHAQSVACTSQARDLSLRHCREAAKPTPISAHQIRDRPHPLGVREDPVRLGGRQVEDSPSHALE